MLAHRVAAYALLRSVVDLRAGVSCNCDHIRLCLLCDRQFSRYYVDLDVAVVVRCSCEVSCCHRHRVLARVGSLCGRLSVVLRDACERDRRIVIAYCVAVYALLRSIVLIACVISGYCDHVLGRYRCDLKRSRYYVDRDRLVVVRCSAEVSRCHRHRVGANVGSLSGRLGVVLRDACERDRRIVVADRVAAYTLLGSVIDLRVGVSGYCDHVWFCILCDRQRSRCYCDLDVGVVDRCSAEVILGHRHRIVAGVGSLCGRLRVVLCDACEVDRGIVLAYCVAAYALLRSVVGSCRGVTGYCDLILISDRCDRQRSRYYSDLDVAVVDRCSAEVRCCHRHRVGAGVGSLCGRLSVILIDACEVDRRVVFAYRVSVYALLGSVVDLRVGVSGYCDLVLIGDRCDRQRSRYYCDLDVGVVDR